MLLMIMVDNDDVCQSWGLTMIIFVNVDSCQ